jgi:hypothetical protein
MGKEGGCGQARGEGGERERVREEEAGTRAEEARQTRPLR